MARAVGAFAVQRPGVILAVVATVGGGGVFCWNALTQQSTKHPAPFFGAKPDPARLADAARNEPPRRSEIAALPQPKTRTDVAPSPAVVVETPAKAAAADPIGALIRSTEAASRPVEATKAEALKAEAAKAEAARVAAVQKALTKLGYGPLKPDGIMGATTKGAVEKFERDRSLPVTGGLGPRTAKQLASASGLPVE